MREPHFKACLQLQPKELSWVEAHRGSSVAWSPCRPCSDPRSSLLLPSTAISCVPPRSRAALILTSGLELKGLQRAPHGGCWRPLYLGKVGPAHMAQGTIDYVMLGRSSQSS